MIFIKKELATLLTMLTVVSRSKVLNFQLENQTLSPQQRDAILEDLKQLQEGFVANFDASDKAFKDKFQAIGSKIVEKSKEMSHEEALEFYQEIIKEFFKSNI